MILKLTSLLTQFHKFKAIYIIHNTQNNHEKFIHDILLLLYYLMVHKNNKHFFFLNLKVSVGQIAKQFFELWSIFLVSGQFPRKTKTLKKKKNEGV